MPQIHRSLLESPYASFIFLLLPILVISFCRTLGSNQASSVYPYEGTAAISEVTVDSMPIRARIYDVPLPLMNEMHGREIGARLGRVRQVSVDNNGRAWADYLIVRVEIDVNRPLQRWVRISGNQVVDGELVRKILWCEVKYERVPFFLLLLWYDWSLGQALPAAGGREGSPNTACSCAPRPTATSNTEACIWVLSRTPLGATSTSAARQPELMLQEGKRQARRAKLLEYFQNTL